MKPFDHDGINVVSNLDELRWDRFFDGVMSERHIGAAVLENSGAWATVMLAVQDIRSDRPCPVRYVLARYRREAGAWRIQNNFRLPRRAVDALIDRGPGFVGECEPPEADGG